ncbi:MAG: DUF2461 domain-containing protein [Pseudomonadota bacterium]|nr:DUF2461 domain-containing protein [Pseudomonadota bacterium]
MPFSPALFTFLTDLAAHNDRDWFTANKGRYETDVKAPLLAFVRALAPRLAEIDPAAICDDKSVFRIYRDTRFSTNKAPYKTHASAQFPRGREKGPAATGYYLHLEPGGSFLVGGLWQPDPTVAGRIRAAIDTHAPTWIAVRDGLGGLDAGASLVRIPRGYAADHPLAEDLRRKSFTAATLFTDAQVCADDFVDRVADGCRRVLPLVSFLDRATT